jgi:hypothetical protein
MMCQPYDSWGAEVKLAFDRLKRVAPPDLAFMHNPKDTHQKQSLVAELTRSTYRYHYDSGIGTSHV